MSTETRNKMQYLLDLIRDIKQDMLNSPNPTIGQYQALMAAQNALESLVRISMKEVA